MAGQDLGHGDTRMIDRVYGHLFEKDRQALRVRMSRRAAEAGSGTSRPQSDLAAAELEPAKV